MKKKAERIVAGILSLSMLMSICSTSVLAETVDLGESTPTTTTYVLDPEQVVTLGPTGDPGEASDPVADPEPSLKVEVDEDDGSVDVTVEDRPEATPENPEVEWDPSLDITGEDAEKLNKEEISTKAEGEETYTPDEAIKDYEDRVIQDGATIEGSEKIETTVKEEVKKDPEGTDASIDHVESDKVGTDGESVTVETKPAIEPDEPDPENPVESVSKSETWDMSKDDLLDLVGKPEAPSADDGWEAKDENTSTKSNTTTAEDGTVTKTEETWTRAEYTDTVDGKLVAGYTETTTVVTEETGALPPDLSEKPENAEEITDENDRVGYTYTTVEVDEQGVLTETTYTVFPEQGTYSKTTTTTTTKLTYAEQTEQGKITISDVIVKENKNKDELKPGDHGNLDVTGPQVDPNKIPGKKEVNDSTGLRDYYVTTSGSLGQIGNNNFVWSSTGFSKDKNQKDVGAVFSSVYKINTGTDDSHNAALYKVRVPKTNENGEPILDSNTGKQLYDDYYVYCVDRGQGLTGGGYDLENLKDSKYFTTDQWKNVESIAVNGYWGVADGTTKDSPEDGSLAAFKKMLMDSEDGKQGEKYWTPERLEQFNDGMALAATQAALWTYASHDKIYTNQDAPVTDKDVSTGLTGEDDPWTKNQTLTDDEKKMLKTAYEALIAKGKTAVAEEKKPTDLIDKEDITNVSVTVNSKLEEESVAAGKDLYDTNLSFTLEVEPSRINSEDLQVTVTIGNQKVTYTLPKAAGDGETVGRTDNTYADGSQDVTYVLKGITLPDGTNVSINLTGTQELGKSAYLLTAEGGYKASQSFVGIFEGTRDVNVDVSFTFEAEQPEATVYIETTEEQVVEQTQQTSWSSSWLSRIFYPAKPTEPDEPTPDKPKEDPKKPEPDEPDSPDGEPQDGAFVIYPENTDNVIMPEENKKRVESVPKTGDDASVWMIMGLLSMAGLVVINLPKKKMEH